MAKNSLQLPVLQDGAYLSTMFSFADYARTMLIQICTQTLTIRLCWNQR